MTRFLALMLLLPLASFAQEAPPTAVKKPSFIDHVLRGVEHENAKNYQGAWEAYSQALELQPDSVVALVRRILCSAKLGKDREKILDLRHVLELQPNSMSDFLSLAWLRATSPMPEVRDGSLAIAYAIKALAFEKTPEGFDCLAAGYAELKQFDRARLELERAVKLFPDSTRIPQIQERLELYRNRKPFRADWSPLSPSPGN